MSQFITGSAERAIRNLRHSLSAILVWSTRIAGKLVGTDAT